MKLIIIKVLILLSFVLKSNFSISQISINQIDSLDFIGNTRKAIDLTIEYLKTNGESKSLMYNTACRFAKLYEVDSAFHYLNKAIKLGLKEIYFLVDDDLNILHNKGEWKNIEKIVIEEFREKNSNLVDIELSIEIIKMGFKDQNGRQKIMNCELNKMSKQTLDSLKNIQMYYDSLSVIFIVKLIKNNKNTFPKEKDIGAKASRYAFLMLQHANHDIRKKYYYCIKKATKNKDLKGKYFAMYKDRLLIDKGRKQIYGTQFKKNDQGVLVLFPIRNKKQMNKKRKKLQMPNI